MQAFQASEASYLRVLASTGSPPELLVQARRNLAGLYHSWARALPAGQDRSARLSSAVSMYRDVPGSALELAGALQERGEAKDMEEAQRLYAELVRPPPLEPSPSLLMAQGNYALLSKDAAFAAHVCDAWEKVPHSHLPPHAPARLKALTVRAYLALAGGGRGAEGALAAYVALSAFAQQSGQALDVDTEHNLAVATHLDALAKAALAPGGEQAPAAVGPDAV